MVDRDQLVRFVLTLKSVGANQGQIELGDCESLLDLVVLGNFELSALVFLGLDQAKDNLTIISNKNNLVFPRVNRINFLAWW